MKQLLRFADEKIFFPFRFRRLAELLAPYLEGHSSVLDVGASCGRLAKRLSDSLGIPFVGIDTHPQPRSFIPVSQYDGATMPFDDASFDCVMMVDVLHHATRPGRLLAEACRVSRKRVLVKDHYWDNGTDLALLKVADYIGNKPYGVPLPYNFLRQDEWKNLARGSGLEIEECRTFRLHPLEPCKHLILQMVPKAASQPGLT